MGIVPGSFPGLFFRLFFQGARPKIRVRVKNPEKKAPARNAPAEQQEFGAPGPKICPRTGALGPKRAGIRPGTGALGRNGALGPKRAQIPLLWGPWGPKRAQNPPLWGPWGPKGPPGPPGALGPMGPRCGDCAEGACYTRISARVPQHPTLPFLEEAAL